MKHLIVGLHDQVDPDTADRIRHLLERRHPGITVSVIVGCTGLVAIDEQDARVPALVPAPKPAFEPGWQA